MSSWSCIPVDRNLVVPRLKLTKDNNRKTKSLGLSIQIKAYRIAIALEYPDF